MIFPLVTKTGVKYRAVMLTVGGQECEPDEQVGN